MAGSTMISAALLLALPTMFAQDPGPPPTAVVAQTPQAAFKELQDRYDKNEASYPERFEMFKAEYRAFAKKHAGSEMGMEAEMFLLTGIWWLEESERPAAAAKAYDHLIEVYGTGHHIVPALEPITYLIPKSKQDALLQRIADGNKHDVVQAAVLFYRAKQMKGEERIEALTTLKKRFGHHKLKYSTYAQLVDAYLSPHAKESLKIGEVAPEIVGVDLNGKPMKLSDFRGKVVVLDFWGDW